MFISFSPKMEAVQLQSACVDDDRPGDVQAGKAELLKNGSVYVLTRPE